MANNGGRQGGGGGNQSMNEHVEFTVKVSYVGSSAALVLPFSCPVAFSTSSGL